jgi:hypothetical protein
MLSGEGEPTFVVWNPEPNQPPPPLTSGWWEARSITGERLARQGTMIKLTGRPMFMRRIVSPIIQP